MGKTDTGRAAVGAYTGRVEKQVIARGSKSEHLGVRLVMRSDQLTLRRRGGNPFRDPVLEDLTGKMITAHGERKGNTLFLSDWDVID